ncbi:MAG: hypothetical protein Q8Q09_27010, partial [Deltaproteobacteria bacterium]|nr:hypothetical protein [Deltaproteobacteria bacterium]
MKWHDLFAKGLADATLAPHCDVTLEESVSLVSLALDIVAEPRDNAEGLRERGLLGRIAMRPCVIEPYSRTP